MHALRTLLAQRITGIALGHEDLNDHDDLRHDPLLRREWPWLRILLRTDSAYAREELTAWCEDNRVDYVISVAKHSRLAKRIDGELARARAEAVRNGRPARRFAEFLHATLTNWSRRRRVVAKAEHPPGKSNPVSSSPRCPPACSRPAPSTSASTACGAPWRACHLYFYVFSPLLWSSVSAQR